MKVTTLHLTPAEKEELLNGPLFYYMYMSVCFTAKESRWVNSLLDRLEADQ